MALFLSIVAGLVAGFVLGLFGWFILVILDD